MIHKIGAGFYHSVSYVYSDADENGELKTLVETINDARITTGYNYDTDNRVTGVVHTINLDEDAEAEAAVSRGYQYDAYGRLSKRIAGNGTASPVVTDELIYRGITLKRIDPETQQVSDVPATTGQVAQFKTTSAGGYSKTYTYTYDGNGNITSVNDGTYTTYYFYDSQNQLIRENSEATGKSRVWTYDGAGNITSRKEYTYINNAVVGDLLSTVQYSYTNSSWGDLLTSYNGQNFTYDPVGNLTFDGTWGYTWEHGRQLKSMTGSSTIWNFTYNADGLRTGRTNGTTTYQYVYNGSSLVQMTVGSNTLYFTYDASGAPLSVTCDGVTFYYVTNLQGDVVAILNSSGTAVVEYSYDAWGNPISTTGTMATTLGAVNPLRYRGYVYDTETTLYYLQSRYYDPNLGRFINADALVSTGQGILGNNMFSYCGNNPVSCYDPHGTHKMQTCYQEEPITNLLLSSLGGGGCTSGTEVLTTVVSNGLILAAFYAVSVCTTTQELVQMSRSCLSAECYTVYFLSAQNDSSNTIVYVGRVFSANFGARIAYHRSKGRQLVSAITNLTYEECRAIEQGGMIYYHTINRQNDLMNKIRGVGPNNGKHGDYFLALMELVNSGMYPEIAPIPASYWQNLSEEAWLNGSL